MQELERVERDERGDRGGKRGGERWVGKYPKEKKKEIVKEIEDASRRFRAQFSGGSFPPSCFQLKTCRGGRGWLHGGETRHPVGGFKRNIRHRERAIGKNATAHITFSFPRTGKYYLPSRSLVWADVDRRGGRRGNYLSAGIEISMVEFRWPTPI